MAMLASKTSYPVPTLGGSSTHQSASSNHYTSNVPPTRTQAVLAPNTGVFTSPTESEFSQDYDGPDSVRNWDEKRVAEWLRSIKAEKYEQLFRAHNFNGDNLLECDQNILRDMGIKKIGDRVRIFVAVKQLRTKSMKKRNRDSFAALDSNNFTPPSDSPRPSQAARSAGLSANRRYSRQIDVSALHSHHSSQKPSSRPSSPLADPSDRSVRSHRYAASPLEGGRRDPGREYFPQPSPASSSTSGRQAGPTGEIISQTPRFPSHLRGNPSLDGLTMGSLPPTQPVIRVIYTGGMTKVLNVKNCRSAEEITTFVLKKLGLSESQARNYCFYVLEGLEPNPQMARRVSDNELMRICHSGKERSERNRLILRKILAGEPDQEELRRASQIAYEESQVSHANAINSNPSRSQAKLQKLTGETWDNVKQPMSPVPFHTGDRSRSQTASSLDNREPERRSTKEEAETPDYPRQDSPTISRRGGSQKLRQFFGGRPPSEMIIHELTTYFPQHQKEEIEKTVRMSVRRSQRLSRAASHLSVVSNASYASSLKDAPPIPSIADAWLTGGANAQPTRASRPLSVSKLSLPQTAFRDSVASSTLQPLQEESPVEPNRKSYVSFDSGSDSIVPGTLSSDPESRQSFFDETHSIAGTSESLNSHLSQIVSADGDEADETLDKFLSGNTWDDVSWMRGALIGQGSFGSVYLALHSVTGELMAVKQVELPSVQKDSETDRKKTMMIAALKHEINLLRDLHHPNIVQYLGTAADDNHLNIFLEYVPGGSIAAMLLQYEKFQEPLIRNFVRQILDGLAYLHERDIIHRDIKGANVLVDNKGGIKISDFGISKRVEASTMLGAPTTNNRTSLQGSIFWMAPEVVRQTAHTKKADIWSLGCLVVEMFSGNHPFPNCSQLQAIFAIGHNQAKPGIPEECSEDAGRFLERTFEVNFEKRPSAEELLGSQFLKPMA